MPRLESPQAIYAESVRVGQAEPLIPIDFGTELQRRGVEADLQISAIREHTDGEGAAARERIGRGLGRYGRSGVYS
jgi:hypothetical protein